MTDCIFCKIVNKEVPKDFIYENDSFASFFDLNQDIKGHALVISKKHFKTLLDMPNSLGPELLDCIKETAIKIMKENDAEGFNVVQNNFEAAWQVVPHLHFHVLPRKKGDGVKIEG